jgi:hypothetical protein
MLLFATAAVLVSRSDGFDEDWLMPNFGWLVPRHLSRNTNSSRRKIRSWLQMDSSYLFVLYDVEAAVAVLFLAVNMQWSRCADVLG